MSRGLTIVGGKNQKPKNSSNTFSNDGKKGTCLLLYPAHLSQCSPSKSAGNPSGDSLLPQAASTQHSSPMKNQEIKYDTIWSVKQHAVDTVPFTVHKHIVVEAQPIPELTAFDTIVACAPVVRPPSQPKAAEIYEAYLRADQVSESGNLYPMNAQFDSAAFGLACAMVAVLAIKFVMLYQKFANDELCA